MSELYRTVDGLIYIGNSSEAEEPVVELKDCEVILK